MRARENSRRVLSSFGKESEVRCDYPHKRPPASPTHIKYQPSGPLGPVSSIPATPPIRLAAVKQKAKCLAPCADPCAEDKPWPARGQRLHRCPGGLPARRRRVRVEEL